MIKFFKALWYDNLSDYEATALFFIGGVIGFIVTVICAIIFEQ